VLQLGTQHAPNLVDVARLPDERRRDAVHAVVQRELRDVADVLRSNEICAPTDSVSVGSVMIAPGMFMFFVSPMVAVFSALQRIHVSPISVTRKVRSPSDT